MKKVILVAILAWSIVCGADGSEGIGSRTVNLFQLGATNDFNGTTGSDIAPYLAKANGTDISVIEISGPGWFLDSSYKPRSGITLLNGGGAVINRTAKGRIVGGSLGGAVTLSFKGKLEIGDRKIVVEPSVFDRLKVGNYILIKKKTTNHKKAHIGYFLGTGKQNNIKDWGPQEQFLKIIAKSESDHTITFDDRANFLYDFDGPARVVLVPDVVEGFRCEGLTFNNIGSEPFSGESVVVNISFMPGCVFKDNIFNLNALSGGIFVNYSKESVFTGNSFNRGRSLDIFIRVASPNTAIVNNLFTDHREGDASIFIEVANYNITINGNRFDTSVPNKLMCAIQMDGKVTNCTMNDNVINGYGVGIRLELGATMNTIVGNTISHCGIAGIRLIECQKNVISNNALRDNGRWKNVPNKVLRGHRAQIFIVDSFDTLIEGNVIVNTLSSKNYMDVGMGISANNIKTCIITDNIISGVGLPIYLNNSSENSITGNTIKDIKGSSGILLRLKSPLNRIEGNYIDLNGDTETKGLLLKENSNLNIIRNNKINAEYMVYLEGVSLAQSIAGNYGASSHICNQPISTAVTPANVDVPNYFRIYRVGDESKSTDNLNEYWEYHRETGKWQPR